MIGVRQNDLGPHIFQFFRRDSLHRRLSADWHEHRGFECAVRGMQQPRPSTGFLVFSDKFVIDYHNSPFYIAMKFSEYSFEF